MYAAVRMFTRSLRLMSSVLAKGLGHDGPQLRVHLLDAPEVAIEVLDPFEVADRDTAGVAEDVRDDELGVL